MPTTMVRSKKNGTSQRPTAKACGLPASTFVKFSEIKRKIKPIINHTYPHPTSFPVGSQDKNGTNTTFNRIQLFLPLTTIFDIF